VVFLVGEQPDGEDQEMENMGFFVETIHMAYRKLRYFHHYWGEMWGLGVDSYLSERSDVYGVLVGVPPMLEG
jgi:hypothetical protein